MIKTSFAIFFAALLLLAASCKNEDKNNAPPQQMGYEFTKPANFPEPVYQFTNNTPTQAGFELGRALFYDPLLSKDSSTACGTCHKQYAAFADAGHAVSHGIKSQLGNRNSPAIFNTAWWPTFFWDGGSTHIELQPIGPITNPIEMDESLVGVIEKLNRSTKYPSMFKAAYGSDTITTQGIMRAFAQFMGLMVSNQSKYDKVQRGETSFTADEQEGYTLFKANCATCHAEPLFTDFSFRNNGLDTAFEDEGRRRITLSDGDLGKFKVPSLRNIALTGPYMHDGRFDNLEDVVNHYTNGIKASATLDAQLTAPIVLNATQKTQLIAFLKSLSDNSFIADTRFSEPVK